MANRCLNVSDNVIPIYSLMEKLYLEKGFQRVFQIQNV